METILRGESITKKFGGFTALKNVEFNIKRGEILGLIGPNGAGKTTLFNIISGAFTPTAGRIFFEGRDVTGLKPHQICKLGIARTFQIVRPFNNMSTLDNVLSGALFGKDAVSDLKDAYERSLSIINFVGLEKKKNKLAKELTLHERKMLELARALATNPKILLIDELIAGLTPLEVQETMRLIGKIRDELGVTIFWIEHVMRAVMGLADRIIVLAYGEKIAEGKPFEIANDKRVIDVYLGGGLIE